MQRAIIRITNQQRTNYAQATLTPHELRNITNEKYAYYECVIRFALHYEMLSFLCPLPYLLFSYTTTSVSYIVSFLNTMNTLRM